MIERYLHTSKDLKAVFLLVDIRHEPNANDHQMYDWIVQNGYQPIVICTKADKLKRSQIPKALRVIRQGLSLPQDTILIPYSSMTKQGREEIWQKIDELTASQAVVEEENGNNQSPEAGV